MKLSDYTRVIYTLDNRERSIAVLKTTRVETLISFEFVSTRVFKTISNDTFKRVRIAS